MGKRHASVAAVLSQPFGAFTAPEQSLDPTLASLFASSSGPVKILQVPAKTSVRSPDGPDISPRSGQPREALQDGDTSSATSSTDDEAQELPLQRQPVDFEISRPRKRRRLAQKDDIETSYLNRLAREEAKELRQERQHNPLLGTVSDMSSDNEGSEKLQVGEIGREETTIDGGQIPRHETLVETDTPATTDATNRTVFLGNVSTTAIKSKSAKSILMQHLKQALSKIPNDGLSHKVESLRFRSTAYVSGAGPKKATYAKKELMDETTKCTNAYVVYSSQVAAKKSAAALNGTVVLDRHLRADCLASSTRIDHRRCVFVGNLSLVDVETFEDAADDESGKQRRAKAKEPADAEEGLWRAFGKAGKVESVRVVRDKETRVGKGFAYVQFVNENSVEAALLMNEKKFPPMLPRKLRVTRARRTKPRAAGSESDKRLSVQGSRKTQIRRLGPQTQRLASAASRGLKRQAVVFEGHRASKGSQKSARSAKQGRKKRLAKPTTSSSRRAAAFKASGGQKKRDA